MKKKIRVVQRATEVVDSRQRFLLTDPTEAPRISFQKGPLPINHSQSRKSDDKACGIFHVPPEQCTCCPESTVYLVCSPILFHGIEASARNGFRNL